MNKRFFSKDSIKNSLYQANQFEKSCWLEGTTVCGIDEVGRGCLAGPLVSAAVILCPHAHHDLLKDSKILSPLEREEAYYWIIKNSSFGIGIAPHTMIDTYGIWQTTLWTMERAVQQALIMASEKPALIVVDAMPLVLSAQSLNTLPVVHFPKGESISTSIAAASIVAKVTRDRLITRLGLSIPHYYLADHKGYGTAKHTQALNHYGPSLIHRRTFKHEGLASKEECYEQTKLLW